MKQETLTNAVLTALFIIAAVVFLVMAVQGAWWHWATAAVALTAGWVHFTDSQNGVQSVRSWCISRLTEK